MVKPGVHLVVVVVSLVQVGLEDLGTDVEVRLIEVV